MGIRGNDNVFSSNVCYMVRDHYPTDYWGTNANPTTMHLQTLGVFEEPPPCVPFEWWNDCAGTGGSGDLCHVWQWVTLGPTSRECPTFIQLQGSGFHDIGLEWW